MIDVTPPAWQRRARCNNLDPEMFFPTPGDAGSVKAKAAKAKAICGRCPVRTKCLEWAVAIEAEEGRMPGIYGGMSSNERRPLYVVVTCKVDECGKPVGGKGFSYCTQHSQARPGRKRAS